MDTSAIQSAAPRARVSFIIFAWVSLMMGSFSVEHLSSAETHRELIFSTARALFDGIVLTRTWNARHGGVYVPVTEQTPPNPYLKDPARDIVVNDSLILTRINPAYMTRQMAELAAESGGLQFRITSLRPLRPENAPSPREEQALQEFDKGVKEVGEIIEKPSNLTFFYMAPLYVEKSCMPCHADQGYKIGEIRGGISILMPLPPTDRTRGLAFGHIVVGTLGLAGILMFRGRLNRSYEIIHKQAVIDVLTGIANRRAFLERMPLEFRRSLREGKPLALILADIDRFKLYNDTYGHAAGDICLKAVAKVVRETIKRPGDFCARYGGEEFVVLLPDTGQEAAVNVAENIRANVERLRLPHERAVPDGFVTISMGVAVLTDEAGVTSETLLQQADKALYAAKDSGRNRVEIA